MLRNRMKWKVVAAVVVAATSGFAYAGAPGGQGGCCLPSGACVFGPEANCIAQGGAYLGDGIPCAGADCRGACCFQDGTCGIGFPAIECEAAGGIWQGVGTNCDDPTLCEMGGEVGACCDVPGVAGCVELPEDECLSSGGSWQGAGVPCTPDPCVDEGACCLNDGCVMSPSQQACESISGIWQGAGTDCTTVECRGACCTADGCIPGLFIFQCDQLMGIWQGDGVPCLPDDPCTGDEIGACCIEDPTGAILCIETTQQDCRSQGGFFEGVGTSCDDVRCEGACCYNDPFTGAPTCSITTEQECIEVLMGMWQGLGTDCDPPNPCIQGQQGACCIEDPTGTGGTICIVTFADECHILNGIYYGDGTLCIPDPCEQPTGACCIEGLCDEFTCMDLNQVECAHEGGTWHGVGSDCDTIGDCVPERGACCREEQPGFYFCTMETSSDCQELGGYWQGSGSDCSDPDVCHINPPDCGVGACCERAPRFDDPLYAGFSNEVTVSTTFAPLTFESPVTVHDIGNRNSAPLGTNWNAPSYSHPSWTLATLGSVFGVALDRSGNIYVTATTAYNLDLVGIGGAGAIYKIDAVTAAVSVFATLPNTGPGLGNIAFDCAHDQLFVSNMEDGKIYRLSLTGAVQSVFDHGAPDGGAAGFAPLGERIWAVAAYRNRVYYSVWNEDSGNPSGTAANEVWSISLGGGSGGAGFSGVAQLEITAPVIGFSNYSPPIADISFSTKGCMLLGERSMSGPSSAGAHNSRVLEYKRVGAVWTPTTSTFAVGVFSGTNAAGGVDYGTDGWPWATGDAIQFGPQIIYGLQGFKPGGGTPATSVLIDINGNIVQQDKTEIGDVEIPCDVCVQPPSRMVAWWPFNEPFGPIANEIIAGNNGTHVGGPTVIPGKVGRALRYDGIDDWVRVPNASSLNFGTNDFSIDCWVRTCVTTGINQILDKRRPSPLRGYSLFLGNGQLAFQMADSSGFTNFSAGAPGFVADGEWHLVAVTVDRNNPTGGRFYVDGVPVGTFNPTGRTGTLVNPSDLWIGRRHPISTTLQYEGDIDEVELFCRVLSAEEIDALWQAGSAGKCRDRCTVPRLTSYCINTSTVVVPLTICNDSAADHQYTWSAAGLPVGPGCTVAGPTAFSPSGSPASGMTVPANSCVTIPITVTRPAGLSTSPSARACYEITILNLDTGRELKCRGQLRRVFKWCFTVIDWDPVHIEFPIGTSVPLRIQVTNDGDEDGVLDYAISSETHGAPNEPSLLSLAGLPPGKPVTGSLSVPVGQSAIISIPISWLKFDHLRFFDIAVAVAQEEGEVMTIGTQARFAEPSCQGDFDGDGDVDLVDFGQFQLCYTGSSGTAGGECDCGKFDGDNDIDLVDFAFFQLAFTGSL